MSALATLATGVFTWGLILATVHAVTRLVAHDHVPGPPTGRCIGCGASIEEASR